MLKLFPRRHTVWLWLAPMILASVLLLGLNLLNEFAYRPGVAQSDESIHHTLDVIAAARWFDETVQQAERSQRGYVLTGDPEYYASYRAAALTAAPALADLRRLVADDPQQLDRLDRLGDLLGRRLASLEDTAGIRRASGLEAARSAIESRHSLQEMQRIGVLVQDVLATESMLLRRREARLAALRHAFAVQSVVASVLAAGLLLLVGIPLLLRRLWGAEATLHESEERYRLLVDSIRDYAILMLDSAGRIVAWNEGAAILTGYDAAEIIGQDVSVLFTPQDLAAGVVELYLSVALLNHGRTVAEGWRVRKDGSRFWGNSVRSAVRGRDGRGIGVAVVLCDMTERHREQEALERRRAALEQAQKMEVLGQLTGGVAHDFNNMLTVIMNSLDTLQARLDGRDAPADVFRLLDAAQHAAARGAGLTRRLLAFSRRQTLEPRRIGVNGLVGGMSELLAHTLGGAIRVETRLASGLPDVLVDANQLENALLNLAINARDAMTGGGRLSIVTAEAESADTDADTGPEETELRPGRYVTIAVSDTGAGMSAETLARVFEPFFTTKPDGKGTGLGLSQVYGFVRQSGGHVTIESEPGHGTTVVLHLPRCQEAASAVPAAAG